MSVMGFDTLKTANALKDAGFDAVQAEALTTAIGGAIAGNVATKEDIAKLDGKIDTLGTRLEGKINALQTQLEGKIDALGTRLDGKIDTAVSRLDGKIDVLKWMLGAVIGLAAAILVRLLFVTP